MPEIKSGKSTAIRILEWAIFPFFFLTALSYTWARYENVSLDRVIHGDQEGYYMYLPAVFIYDGFSGFKLKNCCRKKKETKEWISKYTYGVALMQTPFFLVAHFIAKINYSPDGKSVEELKEYDSGWKPNGFSGIYGAGILLAGAFYSSFGLFLLYFVVKRHTDPWTSLATLLCIFFGTNLLHYTTAEAGMSHVFSFFLFALVLYLLPGFLRSPGIDKGLLIGIPLGLSILIRPSNIIFALVFLLWETYSRRDLKNRLQMFLQKAPSILFMCIPAILFSIPQCMYWNHMTDHWIYYSYRDQGFSNWNSPYFFSVLFHYQNGWLAYTPLMALIFPGLVIGFREKMNSPFLVSILLVLATYIFASWWAWWFGGAFGHRCYVEYYAIFSLPLALVIRWVLLQNKFRIKGLALILIVWLCIGNIKLSLNYRPPWDGPEWTMERYLKEVERAYLF